MKHHKFALWISAARTKQCLGLLHPFNTKSCDFFFLPLSLSMRPPEDAANENRCLCFFYLFIYLLIFHVCGDWIGRCTVSVFRSELLRTDSLLPAVVTQLHDAASCVRINVCTPRPSAAVTAHSDSSHTLHFFNNCAFGFFV